MGRRRIDLGDIVFAWVVVPVLILGFFTWRAFTAVVDRIVYGKSRAR